MPSIGDLVRRWLKRVRESAFAHYAAEERFSGLHYGIGIPATVLSAIVGTSVFVSLDTSVDVRVKILVGLMSITSAVLTGLQTFLRFSERAERHRKIATEYASVRRYIEQHLIFENRLTYDLVETIRTRLDAIADTAPNVPTRLWEKAEKAAGTDFFLAELHPPPRRAPAFAGAENAGVVPPIVIHPVGLFRRRPVPGDPSLAGAPQARRAEAADPRSSRPSP